MNDKIEQTELAELYQESEYWHVDLGEKTVHAKRIGGRFRKLKWIAASIYIPYFLGPYLRWDGEQAILLDIPARRFHLFGLHIWPQEIWIGALLLIAFFLTLYALTSIAGRVFCGYFCWQTVWVDVYTWIEEKLEGPPAARKKLDDAPLSIQKIKIKGLKHAIYILLGLITGISFVSYFIDVYQMWGYYFTLSGPKEIWITPIPFLIGSYISVAFMREQTCFWLCPYARIQGVMTDESTILPTYNFRRGEPRGRIKHGDENINSATGDCIDCNLCYAVCPTGIDIRHGQQEGCITCGLCIDACDSIMEKVNRPKNLISYMSLRVLLGHEQTPIYKRGRVITYLLILLILWGGVLWGTMNINPLTLTVIRERKPLYVNLSDGSIQNRFTLKISNKSDTPMKMALNTSGIENLKVSINPPEIILPRRSMKSFTVFAISFTRDFGGGSVPLTFIVQNVLKPDLNAKYKTVFIGP